MTKTTQVQAVRLPAKQAMAQRKRVTFGASYLNGVLGGVHRDHAKMVIHANTLGLGSPSQLKLLKLETLRNKLATAIMAHPEGTLPSSQHLN